MSHRQKKKEEKEKEKEKERSGRREKRMKEDKTGRDKVRQKEDKKRRRRGRGRGGKRNEAESKQETIQPHNSPLDNSLTRSLLYLLPLPFYSLLSFVYIVYLDVMPLRKFLPSNYGVSRWLASSPVMRKRFQLF